MESITSFVTGMPFGDIAWMALMFVVVLSVLVFFHELGHYLAARSVGVRVSAFSIGFGKEIFGWYDSKGTRWKVAWIPLGGYVQMLGMDPVEEVTADNKHESFSNKSVWQRMWVVFAGPLANFVLAVVFLFGLMMYGEQKNLPEIGKVMEGSAAELAGLKSGDLVNEVNGIAIAEWMEIVDIVSESDGSEMIFKIQRNNAPITVRIQPEMRERTTRFGETKVTPVIGVAPSGATYKVKHDALTALQLGFTKTYEYTATILTAIGKMISGSAPADVGGPIMIAEVAGQAADKGLYPFIMLMVIISINLGLINLFPIPVLDGGHLLFYIIEAIKGSPLNEKAQEFGYRIGMALVLCLMVFAIGKDVFRVADRVMDDGSATQEQSTLEK